ncbi:MAG: hypothetical protein IJU69_04195 [Bacteroidales bacterium]|nr:hypothetical protein [Bacteroidales bacterium]
MKRIIVAALVAVTAAFFASSCQKDNEGKNAQQREITVLAESADEDDVKNYISGRNVLWGSSEYLMLYYNDGSDKFARSTSLSSGGNDGKQVGSFRFSISPATASSYKIGGMYPASAAVSEGNTNSSAYKVVLPAIQNATASSYDPEAYIMSMKPETVSTIPSPYTAYFKRAVALNRLTLTGLSSNVSSVTIEAPGKNLAGGCTLNLVSGATGSVYSGVSAIEVKYSTPLSASAATVWFTSWGVRINAGETLNIKIKTSNGSIYSRTVTAGGAGIRFQERCLNYLEVNCSSLSPATATLKDFAEGIAGLLDVWENNAGSVVVNGTTFTGNILPSTASFTVNGVTYNKAKALDVASQGIKSLVAGGSLLNTVPSVRSYSWGSNPYSEASDGGGAFGNKTVSFTFIQNFLNRQETWIKTHTQWANFCSYKTSSGTPAVTGYSGACSLERGLLILARFYKYLLDNSIYNNVSSAVASVEFDSGLYGKNVISGDATIKDFASQLSTVLATWRTTKGNVGGKYDVHYIPAYATITFNGEQYNKAQMIAGAMTAFQMLYSGKSTSTPMPYIDRSYSYSLYPWTESTGFSEATVGLPFINTMVNLAMTSVSSSGTFPNYQAYPVYGKDSQSASASGQCCTDRMLLILTRFLQYLVDNNINSNIPSACSSVKIDTDLFGYNMAEQNVGMWLNSRDMNGVSLSQLAAKGIDTIFLSFAAISNYGETAVKNFITSAEAQGIEVHIWMQCCYRNGSWVYPLVSSGGSYVQNQSLFDSLVAEAKKYANMGVKGINLDYMRFSGSNSGKASSYGTATATAAVTEMVRQIYVAVKGIDSNITLSGCFMGESVSSLTSYYGQSVSELGRYLDIVLPMIYRHDPEVAYSSQTCINLANSFTSNCKTYNPNCKCWPATDTYSGNTGLPASTIRSDISDFKSSNADGVAIFRYGIGTIPDISDLYK